jgi:hypothetical protein
VVRFLKNDEAWPAIFKQNLRTVTGIAKASVDDVGLRDVADLWGEALVQLVMDWLDNKHKWLLQCNNINETVDVAAPAPQVNANFERSKQSIRAGLEGTAAKEHTWFTSRTTATTSKDAPWFQEFSSELNLRDLVEKKFLDVSFVANRQNYTVEPIAKWETDSILSVQGRLVVAYLFAILQRPFWNKILDERTLATTQAVLAFGEGTAKPSKRRIEEVHAADKKARQEEAERLRQKQEDAAAGSITPRAGQDSVAEFLLEEAASDVAHMEEDSAARRSSFKAREDEESGKESESYQEPTEEDISDSHISGAVGGRSHQAGKRKEAPTYEEQEVSLPSASARTEKSFSRRQESALPQKQDDHGDDQEQLSAGVSVQEEEHSQPSFHSNSA